MSGRVSPFAALTGAEKQIKWLEVQSIRLPYVQGRLETGGEEAANEACAERASAALPRASIDTSTLEAEVRREAQPPAEAPPVTAQKPAMRDAAARADFQRTRHRQYDAVIARMRQAEQRTQGYQALS